MPILLAMGVTENTVNDTSILQVTADDQDFDGTDTAFRPQYEIQSLQPIPFRVDRVTGVIYVNGEVDREQK